MRQHHPRQHFLKYNVSTSSMPAAACHATNASIVPAIMTASRGLQPPKQAMMSTQQAMHGSSFHVHNIAAESYNMSSSALRVPQVLLQQFECNLPPAQLILHYGLLAALASKCAAPMLCSGNTAGRLLHQRHQQQHYSLLRNPHTRYQGIIPLPQLRRGPPPCW